MLPFTCPRPSWHALLLACVLNGALMSQLSAADADTPVDVPDDIGLGERLALVVWLSDRHIPVADPTTLPALRHAYLAIAHPIQVDSSVTNAERERADLSAELYRRFGRNPPIGAQADEIAALISDLADQENEAVAKDQAAAQADADSHPHTAQQPLPASLTKPVAKASAPAPPHAGKGLAVGQPFPALSSKTSKGEEWALSQWAHKVVLVDVWATWCGPCRKEMPNVLAAYRAYHDRGLEIIGVSLDTELPKLQTFISTNAIAWPQIFDGHSWTGPLAKTLMVSAIPTAFLIDGNGVLITTDLRGPNLALAIESALAKVR